MPPIHKMTYSSTNKTAIRTVISKTLKNKKLLKKVNKLLINLMKMLVMRAKMNSNQIKKTALEKFRHPKAYSK